METLYSAGTRHEKTEGAFLSFKKRSPCFCAGSDDARQLLGQPQHVAAVHRAVPVDIADKDFGLGNALGAEYGLIRRIPDYKRQFGRPMDERIGIYAVGRFDGGVMRGHSPYSAQVVSSTVPSSFFQVI